MSDFSLDDFNDVADLAGGIQRAHQIRQQDQSNAKLDRIAELLEGQQKEASRVARLPKCPECKSSIEWESKRCPSCREMLFWCSLPNGIIPIANRHGTHQLTDLMSMYSRPLRLAVEQWQQLAGKLSQDLKNCLTQLHILRVARRSEVNELFGSPSKAIAFAGNCKKMTPSLAGSIWNSSRIEFAKECKLDWVVHATKCMAKEIEDLLSLTTQNSINLLRLCKVRDYDGNQILREQAINSQYVGFAMHLFNLSRDRDVLCIPRSENIEAWPGYYLAIIRTIQSIMASSALESFLDTTIEIACPKCQVLNLFLREHFVKGERCMGCDVTLRPRAQTVPAISSKTLVQCPKCAIKLSIPANVIGTAVKCPKCKIQFQTKKKTI